MFGSASEHILLDALDRYPLLQQAGPRLQKWQPDPFFQVGYSPSVLHLGLPRPFEVHCPELRRHDFTSFLSISTAKPVLAGRHLLDATCMVLRSACAGPVHASSYLSLMAWLNRLLVLLCIDETSSQPRGCPKVHIPRQHLELMAPRDQSSTSLFGLWRGHPLLSRL